MISTDEFRVGESPQILYTKGVGSCVVLTLYNIHRRIGGLAHISQVEKLNNNSEETPYLYVEKAVNLLVNEMTDLNCLQLFNTAKIVGGAHMFSSQINPLDDIGRTIVEKTRSVLKRFRIPVTGEDVFNTINRTVFFDLSDGKVIVNSPERKRINL